MKSIVTDISNDILNMILLETNKVRNKEKINRILDNVSNVVFATVKPYLILIMGILVLMFITNCCQFYYYSKLVHKMGLSQQSDFLTFVN